MWIQSGRRPGRRAQGTEIHQGLDVDTSARAEDEILLPVICKRCGTETEAGRCPACFESANQISHSEKADVNQGLPGKSVS